MSKKIKKALTTLSVEVIIILALRVKSSYSEKYSRGRRGAPAKGVGRVTGARVQIPLSPLKKNGDFTKKLPFLFAFRRTDFQLFKKNKKI